MQELDNEFEIEETEISQKDKKKATTRGGVVKVLASIFNKMDQIILLCF